MKQLLPCGGSHVYSALLALVVLQPYRVTNVEESGSDTHILMFWLATLHLLANSSRVSANKHLQDTIHIIFMHQSQNNESNQSVT